MKYQKYARFVGANCNSQWSQSVIITSVQNAPLINLEEKHSVILVINKLMAYSMMLRLK